VSDLTPASARFLAAHLFEREVQERVAPCACAFYKTGNAELCVCQIALACCRSGSSDAHAAKPTCRRLPHHLFRCRVLCTRPRECCLPVKDGTRPHTSQILQNCHEPKRSLKSLLSSPAMISDEPPDAAESTGSPAPQCRDRTQHRRACPSVAPGSPSVAARTKLDRSARPRSRRPRSSQPGLAECSPCLGMPTLPAPPARARAKLPGGRFRAQAAQTAEHLRPGARARAASGSGERGREGPGAGWQIWRARQPTCMRRIASCPSTYSCRL